jgi:hypothetical protein
MAFEGRPLSLPIAGSGLIFLSSACIVASHGALGELIYKLSGFTQHEFLGLTNKVLATAAGPKRESLT